MKKSYSILIIVFIILVAVFIGNLGNIQRKNNEITNFNKQYEQYLDKVVLGSDVATLINKATDYNEKNNVEKTDDGKYIENEKNSIKIYLKLVEDRDYFLMETITEHRVTEFVKNFSLADFKCSKITYHNTTRADSSNVF